MDHRQFEVRAGVVDRDAPGLGEDDLHEHVGRQQQHHDQLHAVHGVAREDRVERGVARQQGQRAEDEHQRRFDQRAVQGFAAGAHALERASGVHRREDEGHAAQSQEVGEGDQVAFERQRGRQVAYGDEQRGDEGRAERDGRGRAEHGGRRGGVDGALAQQQAHVVKVLGEADALAAREPRAGAVDQSRNRQGRQQKKECVECCHLKSR